MPRAAVTRVLRRTFVGLALVTVVIKVPVMVALLPSLDYVDANPPPAPRGAVIRPLPPRVGERTLALVKSKLRPGDRVYIVGSDASVGASQGLLDVSVAASFFFLPNLLTSDPRAADVVFAIGGSPVPSGRYRLLARDRAGNRVLRRLPG